MHLNHGWYYAAPITFDGTEDCSAISDHLAKEVDLSDEEKDENSGLHYYRKLVA